MEASAVALLTAQTLGAYLLLCLIGAFVSRHPRHSPLVPTGKDGAFPFVPTLGKLAMQVLLPCLLVSTLGANLNAKVFRAGYPLFFWGLLHQLIGLLVGHLARRLGNIPDSFGREFSSACAFGNCGSLPLVVVETLARQPPLSNNSESLERMTTYVFLYLTSWFMLFWSVGILYLAPNLSDHLKNDGAETPGTATARGGCKRMLLAMCNPLMGALLLGLLIGLVQPLQEIFFSDQAPLRFVSSAVETLGKPAIGVVTILMSASLGAFWDKYWTLRAVATSVEARGTRRGMSEMPAPAANLDGCADAAGAGGTGSERQSVSGRTPSYMDVTSTAGAGAGDDGAAVLVAGDASSDHVPFQSMITLAVVRTLVLPVINMALVLCLADLVLPASDDQPFVKLVLMIESAVPSADTIIVVVQQAEKYTTAEALAACYLLQYIFGMLPLGAAIAISMNSFEFD